MHDNIYSSHPGDSGASFFTHWDNLAKNILEVTGAVGARVMEWIFEFSTLALTWLKKMLVT